MAFASVKVFVPAPCDVLVSLVWLVPPDAVLPPVDAFEVTVFVTFAVFEFVTEAVLVLACVFVLEKATLPFAHAVVPQANADPTLKSMTASGTIALTAKTFFIRLKWLFADLWGDCC